MNRNEALASLRAAMTNTSTELFRLNRIEVPLDALTLVVAPEFESEGQPDVHEDVLPESIVSNRNAPAPTPASPGGSERAMLDAFATAVHERHCGSPPSCERSWRRCHADGLIREDDIRLGLRAIAAAAPPPPPGGDGPREARERFCRSCRDLVGTQSGRILPSVVDENGYHAVPGSRILCGPVVPVYGWDDDAAAALIRDDLLGRNDDGNGWYGTSAITTNPATADAAGRRAVAALRALLSEGGESRG